jgi:predicted XRE-type DNA-binding protein
MHQQNMSQRQIAAALGISQMAVWNLLKDAA